MPEREPQFDRHSAEGAALQAQLAGETAAAVEPHTPRWWRRELSSGAGGCAVDAGLFSRTQLGLPCFRGSFLAGPFWAVPLELCLVAVQGDQQGHVENP